MPKPEKRNKSECRIRHNTQTGNNALGGGLGFGLIWDSGLFRVSNFGFRIYPGSDATLSRPGRVRTGSVPVRAVWSKTLRSFSLSKTICSRLSPVRS